MDTNKQSSTPHVQAIIFNRSKWTKPEAEKWLRATQYRRIKPVHVTDQYLRYRIAEPDYKKYIYRTVNLPEPSYKDPTVKMIVGMNKLRLSRV